MKNKVLALVLALMVFTPFNKEVSAVEPETGYGESGTSWAVPCAVAAGALVLVGLGYTGYKVYDYRCFNKMVRIDGNSSYGEGLLPDRPEIEAKRQIRRLFDGVLSRWKRYFDSSASINALYLANVKDCLVGIRNYRQQRIITTPEFVRIYDKLWDKINFLLKIMDEYHEVRVSELIRELREMDALVDDATVLIDEYYYGKKG